MIVSDRFIVEIASILVGDDSTKILFEVDHPKWDLADRGIGFWEKQIPDSIRRIWFDLSVETRIVAMCVASNNIPNENYHD